ncbi:hypothetical protein PN485_08325, partial [Nodularia spumigena CS-588/05]|uniref:hypothetical protein n=1 Tax=Nodularia spumigena TaxID=70799 RepID=UPI00233058F2
PPCSLLPTPYSLLPTPYSPYFLPFLVLNLVENTVVNIINIPPIRIAIANPPVIKSSKLLFSIVSN